MPRWRHSVITASCLLGQGADSCCGAATLPGFHQDQCQPLVHVGGHGGHAGHAGRSDACTTEHRMQDGDEKLRAACYMAPSIEYYGAPVLAGIQSSAAKFRCQLVSHDMRTHAAEHAAVFGDGDALLALSRQNPRIGFSVRWYRDREPKCAAHVRTRSLAAGLGVAGCTCVPAVPHISSCGAARDWPATCKLAQARTHTFPMQQVGLDSTELAACDGPGVAAVHRCSRGHPILPTPGGARDGHFARNRQMAALGAEFADRRCRACAAGRSGLLGGAWARVRTYSTAAATSLRAMRGAAAPPCTSQLFQIGAQRTMGTAGPEGHKYG